MASVIKYKLGPFAANKLEAKINRATEVELLPFFRELHGGSNRLRNAEVFTATWTAIALYALARRLVCPELPPVELCVVLGEEHSPSLRLKLPYLLEKIFCIFMLDAVEDLEKSLRLLVAQFLEEYNESKHAYLLA